MRCAVVVEVVACAAPAAVIAASHVAHALALAAISAGTLDAQHRGAGRGGAAGGRGRPQGAGWTGYDGAVVPNEHIS